MKPRGKETSVCWEEDDFGARGTEPLFYTRRDILKQYPKVADKPMSAARGKAAKMGEISQFAEFLFL